MKRFIIASVLLASMVLLGCEQTVLHTVETAPETVLAEDGRVYTERGAAVLSDPSWADASEIADSLIREYAAHGDVVFTESEEGEILTFDVTAGSEVDLPTLSAYYLEALAQVYTQQQLNAAAASMDFPGGVAIEEIPTTASSVANALDFRSGFRSSVNARLENGEFVGVTERQAAQQGYAVHDLQTLTWGRVDVSLVSYQLWGSWHAWDIEIYARSSGNSEAPFEFSINAIDAGLHKKVSAPTAVMWKTDDGRLSMPMWRNRTRPVNNPLKSEWIRGASFEYHRLSSFWLEIVTTEGATEVRWSNGDWDFDPISTW